MEKKKKRFPDFFILGAPKCGTTSLYAWLNQHPEILMSEPKEPRFFEAEYHRGLDFYRERYFSKYNGEKLTGDANPFNLYMPYVPERIRSANPDARFIILLRNPVDRAFSHWWHMYYRKSKKREREHLSFEEAIMADYERIQNGLKLNTPEEIENHMRKVGRSSLGLYRRYLDAGYYGEQIERYYKYFPKERFKIFLFEEMIEDPMAAVKETCEFLGVDSGECEDFVLSHENDT
ncbi:MAG TPA: sulfotransferase domain-containing protein, partial [Thermodesulfobacteriota bacterium]|nr:sulfotransferase domain-containing protein [Thermodesulfobacteriota bacterium]